MAPMVTLLKDIRPGKFDWKIRVRVLRMWKVPEYNNPNVIKSMEMVLLDEKSTKIQASLKQNLFDTFESILQEGSCYLIQNLLVAQNDPKFRGTHHQFKLTFMRNTMCMKTDDAGISHNFFKFVSFPEILTGLNETYLIDVIGHIVQKHDLRENEKNGVKSLLMDIVLEDLNGNRLDCTLWGTYAKKMHTYLMEHDPKSLVVVILEGCKMRIFHGKIGISNAFDATKLLINPTLQECIDYKERLENANVSLTQVVSYVSSQNAICAADEFLQTQRMSILEVIEVEEPCECVVLAKILDFDTSVGWYYEGCTKCAKKVSQRVGKLYYCENCAVMIPCVRRCKLHAQVMDLTGSICFTLFGSLATQYLEESVTELLDSVDKGGDVSWPKCFDVLLNKDMLFKIQITDKNIKKNWQTYTVKKISNEKSLIDQFKQQHGIKDDEDTEVQNIVSPVVGDNMKVSLDNSEPIQIVEGSPADNDPEHGGTETTPSTENKLKRILEDEYCGTQDSTTKIPKLKEVKKEPSE